MKIQGYTVFANASYESSIILRDICKNTKTCENLHVFVEFLPCCTPRSSNSTVDLPKHYIFVRCLTLTLYCSMTVVWFTADTARLRLAVDWYCGWWQKNCISGI